MTENKGILTTDEVEELLFDFQKNKKSVEVDSNTTVTSPLHVIDMTNRDTLLSIQELRKLTGLSQSKFAKEYHISVHTLRRWEQGVSATPEWYLYSLNELFKYQGYFYKVI